MKNRRIAINDYLLAEEMKRATRNTGRKRRKEQGQGEWTGFVIEVNHVQQQQQ